MNKISTENVLLNFYKNYMNNMRIVTTPVFCALLAVASVGFFAQVDNQQFSIARSSELSLIKMMGEFGTTYVGMIIEKSNREITIFNGCKYQNSNIKLLIFRA